MSRGAVSAKYTAVYLNTPSTVLVLQNFAYLYSKIVYILLILKCQRANSIDAKNQFLRTIAFINRQNKTLSNYYITISEPLDATNDTMGTVIFIRVNEYLLLSLHLSTVTGYYTRRRLKYKVYNTF